MLSCPIFCLGQKNLHLLPVQKNCSPLWACGSITCFSLNPFEVVPSLSELIDSQRTSSVKMGKRLNFHATAVFRLSVYHDFFASALKKILAVIWPLITNMAVKCRCYYEETTLGILILVCV